MNKTTLIESASLEAVVGVFDNPHLAQKAVATMRGESRFINSFQKGSLMFRSKMLVASWLFAVLFVSGCERKEKILDIETPRGEIEIEKSKGSGDVEIRIDRNRDRK